MIGLVIAVVLSGTGSPELPACDIGWDGSVYVRKTTDSWVVARVLPDTAKAAVHPEKTAWSAVVRMRQGPDTVSIDRNGITGKRPLYSGLEPKGQFIEVQSASGLGSEDLIAPGSRVAVFSWFLGNACQWISLRAHLPVGSSHHFAMRLRVEEQWADGIPTFDVLPRMGFKVFPGAVAANARVSLDDYRRFMEIVPTEEEWAEDCRPSLGRVSEWSQTHEDAFADISIALRDYCRTTVQGRAGTLVRRGDEPLPAGVAEWSTSEGCPIEPRWDGGPLNAVRGSYDGDGDDKWAVLCETDHDTRLVIVDPDTGNQVAELARLVGSYQDWSIGVVPPEYFDWMLLGASLDNSEGLPPPAHDAILLINLISPRFVFFHRNGVWTGASSRCCNHQGDLRMTSGDSVP